MNQMTARKTTPDKTTAHKTTPDKTTPDKTTPGHARPADHRQVRDYARIERAIQFLEDNVTAQPALDEVAASAGLSRYHFQRLFHRWAGISPKRFLQCLTVAHAKRALTDSHSVLDAAFEVGLSGPGRLHDLFVACEAMSPGEYKRRGAGLAIRYGFHPSPFGECLLLATERGVCGLAFVGPEGRSATLGDMQSRWPDAECRADSAVTTALAERAFAGAAEAGAGPLALVLCGTNFQVQVWQALLRIPEGCMVTYQAVARAIGRPGAARAVGSAVAANPISYLVPCHRVIRQSGVLGGYYWGSARKKAMFVWEDSRARPVAPESDVRSL